MFNKDKVKGFIAGICVTLVLSSGAVFADSISKAVTAVYNNIKIVIDGEQLLPKDANGNIVEPFIIDGTTYLPVRAVASALGKEVEWDAETNTVFLGKKTEKLMFNVDTDTTDAFSGKTLARINSEPVSGGMFNFFVIQNSDSQYMQKLVDNYSPYGNLQTFTINSVPAAKAQTEQALMNIKTFFAVCDDAEKSGFDKREDVSKAIEAEWTAFCEAAGSKNDLFEFAKANSISLSDLETLAKKSYLANFYFDTIYSEKLSADYDVSAFETEVRETYITAKHILVEDEALAKEIIQKIDGGADFDSLMQEYNTDPGATKNGYTFTKGEMVLPFEEAAFALAENTYTTEPVKTDYGYHIICRLPLNEAHIKEVILKYSEYLASAAVNNYIGSLIDSVEVTFTEDYQKYINTIK